jgi:hypothetical protein
MNKYQIAIPPNGDLMQVAADRMENVDGDLKFFQGNTVVGEARYWQAWTMIGQIGDDQPMKSNIEQHTIDRLVKS